MHNNPDTDTAKDVALFAHVSKSCVSDAIESLTKKGFIVGKQDEADRRYIHLEIQESARQVVEDALIIQQEFVDIVLNDFSKDEEELK